MVETPIISIIIIILATWRLSSFFSKLEDGPFNIFHKLRKIAGVRYDKNGDAYGSNHFAKGLLCLWCNSVWFAIILVLLYYLLGTILMLIALPLAISAVVIIIDQIIGEE